MSMKNYQRLTHHSHPKVHSIHGIHNSLSHSHACVVRAVDAGISGWQQQNALLGGQPELYQSQSPPTCRPNAQQPASHAICPIVYTGVCAQPHRLLQGAQDSRMHLCLNGCLQLITPTLPRLWSAGNCNSGSPQFRGLQCLLAKLQLRAPASDICTHDNSLVERCMHCHNTCIHPTRTLSLTAPPLTLSSLFYAAAHPHNTLKSPTQTSFRCSSSLRI
jgi:hypothetical protein